ncbi:MAG TPA: hypothetical protein PLD20_28980 [Blastocatellia bacterium]|nr:hypothetical protein [Blastocatellia bacterium]HMV83208.1 hypothetical protein [Blastocatellia bacterium]HMX29745.1 hypothetical protein [Blastocatellia bacterium]HMZ22003.1 hypothetical protein [Blastocatellia bacterium]HNG33477.1 hypothetical protein [Blastocatellia bacterium]
MEMVTILPEESGMFETRWHASSNGKQSIGKTAGEALDNLTGALDDSVSGSVVVVQPMRPDRFFTAEQRARLQELMTRWRTARDAESQLPQEEQDELESLISAQLEGAAQRAEALLHSIQP